VVLHLLRSALLILSPLDKIKIKKEERV